MGFGAFYQKHWDRTKSFVVTSDKKDAAQWNTQDLKAQFWTQSIKVYTTAGNENTLLVSFNDIL